MENERELELEPLYALELEWEQEQAQEWEQDRGLREMKKERIEAIRRQSNEALRFHQGEKEFTASGQFWGRIAIELLDEIEPLQEENRELKTGTWCAYCGERFPMDTMTADQVGSHIATCPKHPVYHLTQVSIKLASEVLSLTGMTGKIVAEALVQQYLDERKGEG